MGLHHRNLIAEICASICYEKESCSSSDCVYFCPRNCSTNQPDYYNSPPPPSPPIYVDKDDHHPSKPLKFSTFLIITLTLLGSAFLVLFCYFIYARYFSRRRRSQHQTEETQDSFFDEEHGPEMDHPIWYIGTIGLQQSIINEITVCRYKKGEGLVEGTECSVCLREFQEDENLRLLPKCDHAFHLLCIDRWLRSHTNCPLCRAPIVTNPERERTPSLDPNVVDDSSSTENTHMGILEISGENNGGMENRAWEAEEEAAAEDGRSVCDGSEAEVDRVQARRILVSLDSSFAAKGSLAPVTSLSVEPGDGNSKNVRRSKGSSSFRTRSLQSVGTSMKRSQSYNGKHLLSWNGRSQRNSSVLLRSF